MNIAWIGRLRVGVERKFVNATFNFVVTTQIAWIYVDALLFGWLQIKNLLAMKNTYAI